jgi:hypothetical protein
MHALYERDDQKLSVRRHCPWYWLVAVMLLYPVFVEWDAETSGQAFGIVSSQLLLF